MQENSKIKIPKFLMDDNLKKIPILILAILVIGIGLIAYFTWPSEKEEAPLVEEVIPEEIIPEEMKAGEVGELEIKEGQTEEEVLEEVNPEAIIAPVRPPGTPLPPVTFNTKGTIVSVQKGGILVEGNGSNFEDQKSRTLNIQFTNQTITFEKENRAKYQGLEGLKYLSPGDQIMIESSQNIRSKTDFSASYINKI